MQVYFNGYTDEKIVKGRNSYNKMVISYSYQGQSKTQQIMSFANPSVYAAIPGFKEGDSLDVEITKNDAGYNTWASVKLSEGATSAASAPSAGTKGNTPVARSTYETPEERAKKQVYIIKQSCLAQAVAAVGEIGPDGDTDHYISMAQQFVDWVLDDGSDGNESN